MGKLDGKVAIVTASTDGIGFAIAKRLGSEGAHVVISSRTKENVDRALRELKALDLEASGAVCDVTKKEDRLSLIEKAVVENGGVDILVSNAGKALPKSLLCTTENEFDDLMELNVKSTFMLVKEVVPEIEKRGKGSIVFVSSMAGVNPPDMLSAYAVGKAALNAMVKTMTRELAAKNIRINCIAPAFIKTNMSEGIVGHPVLSEKMLRSTALARFGEPEECANVVVFLVSDEASYVTGAVYEVSGGLTHAQFT